jgi:hypothetical protein
VGVRLEGQPIVHRGPVMMLNWRDAGCQPWAIVLGLKSAPVAQLDRAAASEAVGQKFESSRAHHNSASQSLPTGLRDVRVYRHTAKFKPDN